MNLVFERVLADEPDKIVAVYEIIRSCGEDMFRNQGLLHWSMPYPKESIDKNCAEREVFLVRNLETKQYVHTFQLEFQPSNIRTSSSQMTEYVLDLEVAIINKFATSPHAACQGIGKHSLSYIEAYCHRKGIPKLRLDVYDKSKDAIRFYNNNGFKIVGTKPTRYFTVYLMEKSI